MQIIVDSLMTHYERKGKGKVVLILHGWADSSHSFRGLTDALARHYDVIALDLPGFGGSQASESAWNLDNYADFVQEFLKKSGVKETYAVIGHSNGGAIAIRGLGRGKLKAEKLVLLASAGIRNVYTGRKRLLKAVAKAGKLATVPLPKSAKQKLRQKLYKTAGSDMLVAEHMQETFKKIVADDVREDAQNVKAPVFLIYGELDEQTPVWQAEQFRELFAHASLEVLPGVGHFVHLEKPEQVEKSIEEFIQ